MGTRTRAARARSAVRAGGVSFNFFGCLFLLVLELLMLLLMLLLLVFLLMLMLLLMPLMLMLMLALMLFVLSCFCLQSRVGTRTRAARARSALRDGGHRVSCLWLPAPVDVGGAFADTDADADADAAAVVADAGACVFGPWLQPPEDTPKQSPKCLKKQFQNDPRRVPNSSQNCSKMSPEAVLDPSWRPLGSCCPFCALILPSTWPLGALLEASGPQKSNWGSAPGRPEATWETGFSYLGGQIPSQKEPRRVPNRGPKAVQDENGKTLKFDECLTKFVDF